MTDQALALDYQIPEAAEAERALLGDCLLDPEAASRIVSLASPELFFDPTLSEIFKAFRQRVQAGKSLDDIELQKTGVMTLAQGVEFRDLTSSAALWPSHLNVLRSAYQRRAIATIGEKLKFAADCWQTEPPETIHAALTALSKVCRLGGVPDTSQEEALEEYAATVKAWDDLPLARTGIKELDRAIGGGLLPGEMMALIGGEGSMKTSVALKIVDTYLREVHQPTLYISLDMRKHRIALRRLMPLLDANEKEAVMLMKTDDPRYLEAVKKRQELDDGLFHLVDGPHGVKDIEALLAACQPGLVVLDYLTAVTGEPGDKDYEIMRRVCDALRQWQTRFSASWVLLSQMSENAKAGQRMGEFHGRAAGGNELSRLLDVGLELMMDSEQGGEAALEGGRIYEKPPQLVCTIVKARAGQKYASYAIEYVGHTMTLTGRAERVFRKRAKQAQFTPPSYF